MIDVYIFIAISLLASYSLFFVFTHTWLISYNHTPWYVDQSNGYVRFRLLIYSAGQQIMMYGLHKVLLLVLFVFYP